MKPQKIPGVKNLFLLYLYAKTACILDHINSINEAIGATDIYLVDQIMKNRYKAAGVCGKATL